MKKLILAIILGLISTIVNSEEDNLKRSIRFLKRNSDINSTLLPTVYTYEEICGRHLLENEFLTQFSKICNAVIRSQYCKNIDKNDLLKCESLDKELEIDFWALLAGCSEGILNSTEDLLNIIWDIIQWFWKNTISSETREETFEIVSEYMDMVKLYLYTEFQKNYQKLQTNEPYRTIQALQMMAGTISNLFLNILSDIINQQYKEFSCLNNKAKTKVMCKLSGDLFISSASLVGLIKYAGKGLKTIPNIKKAFNGMNNLPPIKKIDINKKILNSLGKRNFKISSLTNEKAINIYYPYMGRKRGKKLTAPSHKYEISFSTENGEQTKFNLFIPAKKNGGPDEKSLKRIIHALEEMPEKALINLTSVRLNPFPGQARYVRAQATFSYYNSFPELDFFPLPYVFLKNNLFLLWRMKLDTYWQLGMFTGVTIGNMQKRPTKIKFQIMEKLI